VLRLFFFHPRAQVLPYLDAGLASGPVGKIWRKQKFLDVCILLRCYAALNGSYVQTFRDNLTVLISKVKKPKKTS
jgi:hypothetical protein